MSRIHVIIPALDERPNLPAVLDDLEACARRYAGTHDLRLVLVDDGSTDGTGEYARSRSNELLPVDVVRHEAPMGPGKAFADAFTHIRDDVRNTDLVLTLEADNTSRLELLDAMLACAGEGFDVVFASPYMAGGGVVQTALHRVVLSKAANTFVKHFLGLRGIKTVSSFFRLYRGEAFRHMQRHYGSGIVVRVGFESMVEMAMKLRYVGLSIREVPMVLDTSRRIGVSRMRIGRTTRGYLVLFAHRRRWRAAARLPRVLVQSEVRAEREGSDDVQHTAHQMRS